MSVNVNQVDTPREIARVLMSIAGALFLIGAVNLILEIVAVTFIQIGLVLLSTGLTILAGAHYQDKDSHALAMGFYVWGISIVSDFVLHTVFLIDINGVQGIPGFEFLTGPVDFGFLQLEPWWYFTFDTGFVGFVIGVLVATVLVIPEWPPYRYAVWPLLGGLIKSMFYGKITQILSVLTGGIIATRAVWEWTTYWTFFYNDIVILYGGGEAVPLAYHNFVTQWPALFLWSLFLHAYCYWIGMVVARRWIAGKDNYT